MGRNRAVSASSPKQGRSRSLKSDRVGKEGKPEFERENPWEYRTLDARKWGEKLRQSGGAGPSSVKHILKTLKDSRSLSEISLRRTAVEALVPAAEIGHRGALAAQAARLTDSSESVRRSALLALRAAAGGQRPQVGGAVAVALQDALPPKNARYNLESRRRGADALLRLAPAGDAHLLATATKWLEDEDAEVRLSSTQAIGHIGSGQEDIEAVAARLTDSDWRVSRAAVHTLEQLATGRMPPGRRHSITLGGDNALPAELPSGSLEDKFEGSAQSNVGTPAVGIGGSPSMMPRASMIDPTMSRSSTMNDSLPSLTRTSTMQSQSSTLQSPSSALQTQSSTLQQSRRSSVLGSSMPMLSQTGSRSRPSTAGSQHHRNPSNTSRKPSNNSASSAFGTDALAESACLPQSTITEALSRCVGGDPGTVARLSDSDAEVRQQATTTFASLAPGDRSSAVRMSAK
eukprot:CAMPEP_0115302204 /NCGR_PEP_ID=MMETSP0270-20121206/70256_1 /TAXON_ID=71861 /ORGANISM="Scrippsiella trochoidea, Strain CCMP3099" /LENGTH=459 /DNA_ID=CAMNT_0002720111 /DNA_START=11 /DNA_END=1387 /DNA_ORIENTATION=-